jgi:DNA-binding GntR family transcriptional regulator
MVVNGTGDTIRVAVGSGRRFDRPLINRSAAMANPTKRPQAPNEARGSKADRAYEAIRGEIVAGAFQPGTRLVLDRLARELGMSTLPVREAIRRLEAEGYVEFRQNVGATVSALDAESFVEALETFAVLESAATAQAAPHLSTADLDRARALNASLSAALDRLDRVAYATLHDEFHELLAARCPNSHLVRVLSNERARLQRIRLATLALGAAGRREVDEHARLLDLIAARAPDGEIEDLCRSHIGAVASSLTG